MSTVDTTISAIRETCVLATFSGGYYNWKRRDRTAEKEYAASKGIHTLNVGEYRKNLFAGTDGLLSAAKSLITEARAAHYDLTLPSPYDGYAFLRNTNIMRYKERMLDFEHKLGNLNANLAVEWPNMLTAAKTVLGPLFNADDYPTLSTVTASNYIKTTFVPIPSGANVILDGIDATLREEIANSIDASMTAAYKAANLAAWTRLLDIIENAKANLFKGEDGRFRTEWHSNLSNLLSIMDGLNITNDADLAEFSQRAHTLLTYSPDDLKENPSLRNTVGADAERIFDEMSTIFASIGGTR